MITRLHDNCVKFWQCFRRKYIIFYIIFIDSFQKNNFEQHSRAGATMVGPALEYLEFIKSII